MANVRVATAVAIDRSSCLLQAIHPLAYLYDVFRRLPDHPSKWVHELTPLNWRLAVEAGDIKPLSLGQLV